VLLIVVFRILAAYMALHANFLFLFFVVGGAVPLVGLWRL
jgi:hypothetical protein